MGKKNIRQVARTRRKQSIRKRVVGTSDRPRLTIYRSSKHIYAQIIDDSFMVNTEKRYRCSKTLITVTSQKTGNGGNKEGASLVGAEIAKRALEAGINTVTFDRNGFLYHGRVKALADAAREAGLQF